MDRRKSNVWKSVDWITIGIYAMMVIAGWFCICGATYEFDSEGFFNLNERPGLQLIWIGTSFVLIFLILMLDKDFFETFAFLLYGFVFFILVLTIFIAPNIKGSHSWLVLGSIHIQPAEFAKFAAALTVAKIMNKHDFNLLTFKNFSIVALLILAPMYCIILQKETGTALVFLAFALMLYREGMSGFILLSGVCAIAFFVIVLKYGEEMLGITPVGQLFVTILVLLFLFLGVLFLRKDNLLLQIIIYLTVLILFIGFIISLYIPVNFVWIISIIILLISMLLIYFTFKNMVTHYVFIALFAILSLLFLFSIDYVFNDVLEYHQQMRIKVTLGLENDPTGAGYNVNQSKIAIGSGGLWGKGFLKGTQTKLKYVPEKDTDFIFCSVGEEFGLWGSLLVLGLFGFLIIRIIYLAERQNFTFGRVYGYCVASIFLFHLMVNLGMVLGVTPVIGIPLPFFSYGGSSLLGFTILLFIFLRIDAGRKETL